MLTNLPLFLITKCMVGNEYQSGIEWKGTEHIWDEVD